MANDTENLKLLKLQSVLSTSALNVDDSTLDAFFYIVYRTVLHNPSVTENKVVWALCNQYSANPETIKHALSILKNKALKNALKTWHVKDRCHLHPREDFEDFCVDLEVQFPYLKLFIPPDILTTEKKHQDLADEAL
jgi:hypothetical protein